MSCGAEIEANELFVALTAGEDFTLPDIDMSGPGWDIPGGDNSPVFDEVPKLTNDALTTKEVDGSGTFDFLMKSVSVHLDAEFKKGRITGAEYVKAYIALTEAAMSNATQFLLNRDQAYWQAIQAQMNAITSRTQLAIAKTQYVTAKVDALATEANYALTKLKLSTESSNYCISQYNLTSMLPTQKAQVEEQTKVATQQITLIKEQTEAQRAQTSDTRTDGATVMGLSGKQKELYSQQITSYQRDAEVKAARMFSDAWITQKTIDEGLVPPPSFANASVDEVMSIIKVNNGL